MKRRLVIAGVLLIATLVLVLLINSGAVQPIWYLLATALFLGALAVAGLEGNPKDYGLDKPGDGGRFDGGDG